MSARRGFRVALAGGVLAGLAVFAVYWPAHDNAFIWDDLSYLVYSPAFRDPALWQEALFHPPTGQAVFRPLTLLSFALPLWAGFSGPELHHIVSFALHAINVVLVTLIAWRIGGRDFPQPIGGATFAALCGLIYGVHPALTEAVLWIACRFDLLMAFFLLLAMLVDRSAPHAGWARALGVSALFLAAALCKETAVGFLLALPIVHLAVDRTHAGTLRLSTAAKVWVSHWKVYAGLLAACVIYLLLRVAALGTSFGTAQVMERFEEIGSVGQRALVIAASLSDYISDVIWPSTDTAPNRVLALPVAGTARITLALAGAGGVAVLALILARFSQKGRGFGLLVLAFMVFLLPVSNVVPAPTNPGELQTASRYVTFPLVFVCLAVYSLMPTLSMTLAARQPLVRMLPWAIAGSWVVLSIASVRATIPLWKDEGTFFRWAVSRAPPSSWPYLYINLGSYYVNVHDLPRARDAFGRAIEAQPRTRRLASLAWYNLGNVEARLGNPEQAARVFQGALVIDPGNLFAHVGLAQVERQMGNAQLAADVAEKGLRRLHAAGLRHAVESVLQLQLGLAYRDLARLDEAVAQLAAAHAGAQTDDVRAEAGHALEAARKAPR